MDCAAGVPPGADRPSVFRAGDDAAAADTVGRHANLRELLARRLARVEDEAGVAAVGPVAHDQSAVVDRVGGRAAGGAGDGDRAPPPVL